MQYRINRADMGVNSAQTDDELFGNLGVRQSGYQQRENFKLAWSQIGLTKGRGLRETTLFWNGREERKRFCGAPPISLRSERVLSQGERLLLRDRKVPMSCLSQLILVYDAQNLLGRDGLPTRPQPRKGRLPKLELHVSDLPSIGGILQRWHGKHSDLSHLISRAPQIHS